MGSARSSSRVVVEDESGDESDGSVTTQSSASSASSGGEPGCCDYLRARRIWCGLHCFGCMRDPLAPFRPMGVDCSHFYWHCGFTSFIAGLLLIVGTYICFKTRLVGAASIAGFVPWILLLLIVGAYLLSLVCVSRTGVRLMMYALVRSNRDADRPRRVRKAYDRMGNLTKDLSVLDSNSAFAIQQMSKSHDEIMMGSIRRALNSNWLDRMKGDSTSQRFLLAAHILAAKDPLEVNEAWRIYPGDVSCLEVCKKGVVPPDRSRGKLDEVLRQSGAAEEVALSMMLLPKARAMAMFLSWSLGRQPQADLSFGQMKPKRTVANAIDAVDEMNAVRLLAVLSVDDRQRVVTEYDNMCGGQGAFKRHVQEVKMLSEFCTALLTLADFTTPRPAGQAAFQMLQHAILHKNKDLTIRLLCGADDSVLDSLPQQLRDDARDLMPEGIGGRRQSNTEAGNAIMQHLTRLPQLLDTCTPQPGLRASAQNMVNEASEAAKQACQQVLAAYEDVIEDIQHAIVGADPRHMVDMLLRKNSALQRSQPSNRFVRKQSTLQRGQLSDRFVGELKHCMQHHDRMGLVCLLMHLDEEQRELVQQQYRDDADIDSDFPLTEAICKHNWHLLELILIGFLMPKEWIWARVIYESCCGGVTGFGTDEETLTSVLALNWHRQRRLRMAVEQMFRWKTGRWMALEQLLDNEIENANFKMILLNFLS